MSVRSCVLSVRPWMNACRAARLTAHRLVSSRLDMRPISTSTCPSSHTSWTLESDSPWEGNSWNDAPNTAYHYETGGNSTRILGLEWSTAISGTSHFARMPAPTWRTLVWRSYHSGAGLIQNDLGLVVYGIELGDYMDDKGPCAPVIFMLFRLLSS